MNLPNAAAARGTLTAPVAPADLLRFLRRDIERTQARLPEPLWPLAEIAWNYASTWLPDGPETFAEIDAEAEKTTVQRGELAVSLPDDLLALYEKVRSASSGIGAAALHRGRCEGCHLQLNTTDLNRLRDAPEDEVLRCDECRRILVRTAESGL